MSEKIGDFRFTKKFAWFPKKITLHLNQHFPFEKWVFLETYYKVSRYRYITWAVPAVKGWDNFSGEVDKETMLKILEIGDRFPFKYALNLFETQEEIDLHLIECKKDYENMCNTRDKDPYLLGWMKGINSR